MKLKDFLNFLTFKLFVKLLCLLCLMYQTYMLSEQYLTFNSVINMKFTANVIDKLPAITICYNKYFSFEKLAQRYPKFSDTFENYTNFVNKFSKVEFNRSYGDIIIKNNEHYSNQYYELIGHYNSLDFFNENTKENYLDIFDNLSISFYDDDNHQTPCIHVSILGDKGAIVDGDGNYKIKINPMPIESIYLKRGSKCFTYFYGKEISFLNKPINIVGILISWYFHYSWFPFSEANRVSFAIHQPNVKPGQKVFHNLEQNTNNMVRFSKVEEKRLMYYDNCREYNKSRNDFQTRIYCLEHCIFKSNMGLCQDELLRKSPYLLFRDQITNLSYSKNRQCKGVDNYIEIVSFCNDKCEEDCYQTHYLTSVEKIGGPNLIRVKNERGVIDMKPNSNPNILIEHFAEITFISLICNLGGLIGMYLGISLESICCDLWYFSRNLFLNHLWIKISNYIGQTYIFNINCSIKQKIISKLRRQR